MLVHDKPMIYYALSTLMLAGVRELLVISAPQDAEAFRYLLGDGSQLGLSLRHAVQPSPGGPAQAISIGARFLAGHPVALALSDNIFHGEPLAPALARHARAARPDVAHVFACRVMNPGDYGVIEFDATGGVMSIEEKPSRPRSDFAVPGLYFYPADLVQVAAGVAPGPRGGLEITAVNEAYRRLGRLTASRLQRGISWLDIGTLDAAGAAGEYVRMVEARHGGTVGCVEAIAWQQGWISDDDLLALAAHPRTAGFGYGPHLARLVAHRRADAEVISLPDAGRTLRG